MPVLELYFAGVMDPPERGFIGIRSFGCVKFRVKLRFDNPVAMVFGKEMAWPEVAESGRTGNRVFGRYRTIRKLRCTSTGMITDSVKPAEVIGQATVALAQRN